ncbi:DUF6185 family protein [Streptomyces phaeochromogenes]|uniref:DUF6185 family protein n=1 Tax=Streptomyces phaeochromogenes TaxID=1923 RepID=A0ABZ1HTW8_STRPH|nr:DUF6185 family protein [Streptomyces phaeochromogenes]WSD22036.1 DUF6185 family protein [Streptomyces phaeochromogenes]
MGRGDGEGSGHCKSQGLKTAEVEASLRLDHDDRTYTKLISELTIKVPMTWPLADGLLLSPASDRYRRAMGCLAKGDIGEVWTNWQEWRSEEPAVTPVREVPALEDGSARWVEVVVTAHGWVDQRNELRVGPWTVHVGKAKWFVRLTPPAPLQRAIWQQITVDPGRSGAVSAKPEAAVGRNGDRLAWYPARAAPSVEVRIAPAWPRSFAAQDDNPPFSALDEAGVLLWWLILVAALWCTVIMLPRAFVPDPVEDRTRDNLRNWSWALFGVVLVVQGRNLYLGSTGAFEDNGKWQEQAAQAPWAWLTAAVAGRLLLWFARPSETMARTGALLGVLAVVPALCPGLVGLVPQEFVKPPAPSDVTVAVVWGAAACSMALLIMGSAAAVHRLAVDGGVYPPRDEQPRLRPLLAGTFTVVVIMAVCYGAAAERDWNRASWLLPHIDPEEFDYGPWHRAELRSNLLWFTHNAMNWWCAMLWIPSGLAILTVLRARARRTADATVGRRGPTAADRALLLLLFPVMIALNIGQYTASEALIWVWFFAYLSALACVLRIISGQAVGDQLLQKSREPLKEALRVADRPSLLDRARTYREIHARLRRLDQGQADDANAQRRNLEKRLSGLHRWRPSTGSRDRLPHNVSVVDAALALGPGGTWWENGVKAAWLTQPVALPLSAGLVWAHQLRGESLTSTLYDRLGLPDVLVQLILWQIGYAAAGLVLGTLWHQLPGRRGPTKALLLALAYALPAGLFALGNWALKEEQTGLAFSVAAMLLVLTLTGILMDLETFREEHHYWRSRIGLLYSVYQMRFFSIQLAWLLAQAAAIATIWQFFAEDAGTPPEISGGSTAAEE